MRLIRLVYQEPIRLILFIFFKLFYGIKIKGTNLIPRRGPVLIVSNHQSYYDPVILGMWVRRPLRFAAMVPLFKVRLLAFIMRLFHTIPLERERPDKSAYKEIQARLNKNEIVVLFPEGSRTPDGNLQPLKPGFARIAIRNNARIVPAVIVGAYEAWHRHRTLPRLRGKIIVKFYPPISSPPDCHKLSLKEIKALERQICSQITKIFRTRLSAWQRFKNLKSCHR